MTCRAALLLSLLLIGCRDETKPLPDGDTDSSGVDPSSETEQSGGTADVAAPGPLQFRTRTNDAGIDFVHCSGDSAIKPFPAANGSGVAVIDADMDGRCDLYFATGNTIADDASGPLHSNQFYRNTGDWKFRKRTTVTGLGHNGFSAGVTVGDFNSDGFPDVYVACYGPNRLYENQGDGTFVEVAGTCGVDDERWGTSVAFLDIDADGKLDLYSGHYGKWSLETNQFCGDRDRGLRMFCSPTTVPPEHDGLYRNPGDGRFQDVAREFGLPENPTRTQGVLAADLNGDSYTDLYLGNDLNANSLLISESGKKFSDRAEIVGSGYDRGGVAQAGMGVTTADIDRDGRFDLFVTNFENEHNAFYRRDAGGFYQDVSHLRGLAAGGMPYIGWGTMFADFDCDGWHDAIVINGHTDDNLHELGREGDYEQPPLIWKNDGGRFISITSGAGDYFDSVHPGRGLALADLDGDLDPDVVCCHQDTRPDLLENASPRVSETQGVLQLRLIGRECIRDGIGTRVQIIGREEESTEQLTAGGSYLSSSQHVVSICSVFPDAADAVRLRVIWTGGRVTETPEIASGGRFTIVEPAVGESICRVFSAAE